MNKAIVTGATGFVGSNLVKHLLNNGFDIAIIARNNSDLSNLKGTIEKITVFKYNDEIENLILFFERYKPLLVFHLASNFIAEHEFKQIDSLIQGNITFGLHVLEAMKETGVKHLINTGTSWQHYKNEDFNPVCLYAATKKAFESLIEFYIKSEDFKVITLKLFDTYGETDTRPKLINLLHKYADEKIELNMSPGEQLLNLVHIEDVCRAYYIAFQIFANYNQYEGQTSYVVIHDENYSLKQVVELFERVTGKHLIVNWGGRPYRRREVMTVWDNGIKLPNWQAKISLEEGIKKYIDAYK